MIATADGKSRGVLNDQTTSAQGDHRLISFDQTAGPLAQGGIFPISTVKNCRFFNFI
jgi:hypothetical protein